VHGEVWGKVDDVTGGDRNEGKAALWRQVWMVGFERVWKIEVDLKMLKSLEGEK
jgi:hypothetical protein